MTTTNPASFLTDLLARVGTGIAPAPVPDAIDTPAPVVEPAEIVHMLGFTGTDDIRVGGTVIVAVDLDGFHGTYRPFRVVKVNRVSVVVDMNGESIRIPVRRIITYRPAEAL